MNNAIAALVALITALGGTGTIQYFLNRNTRKAEAARAQAEQEQRKKDKFYEDEELLAKARNQAQRAAIESSKQRYDELDKAYNRTSHRLWELQEATAALIDVVDTMVSRMRPSNNVDTVIVQVTPAEYLAARTAIREARRHLN